MGLPTTSNSAPSSDPSTSSEPPTQTSSQVSPESSATGSSDPANLPTAALELAAKLFDLARAGDTSTLRQYLSAGLKPNLTNNNGDTLLMLASYYGHAETVRMLLQQGADANTLNAKHQTPLAGAVFKGHDEVVEALVKDGNADVTAGEPNAVQCAGMFGRTASARTMGIELPEGSGGVEGARAAMAALGSQYTQGHS